MPGSCAPRIPRASDSLMQPVRESAARSTSTTPCRSCRNAPQRKMSARWRPSSNSQLRNSRPTFSLLDTPRAAHLVLRIDAVDQHLLELATVVEAAFDQTVDEIDGAHLAHQARVEAERVDAVEDGLRGLRHLLDMDGVDHDEQHVGGGAVVDDRKDRRVAHIAAVPEIFAVDLDRLEHRGNAGRGDHGVERRCRRCSNTRSRLVKTLLAHTKSLTLSERLSASKSICSRQDVAQRMIVAGVHLIGRQHARQGVQHDPARRIVEASAASII